MCIIYIHTYIHIHTHMCSIPSYIKQKIRIGKNKRKGKDSFCGGIMNRHIFIFSFRKEEEKIQRQGQRQT